MNQFFLYTPSAMENTHAVDFYDQTATNLGKQFNLWSRGICYDLYYLPRLLEWNIFPNNSIATEIGCGMGHKLEKTRQVLGNNIHLSGIEASTPLLDQAYKKHPDLKPICVQDNAFTLNTLEDNSQDVLMYYQILHHFNGNEIERAITTAARKLKPNGKIVVIDTFNMNDKPLRKQWFNVIEPIYAMLASRSRDGGKNYNNQPKDHFINFMKSHGFNPIHTTGDKFPYVISEMIVFEKRTNN